MKIISIINNKGGVGKTTTVQNLAAGLIRKNFTVGLIDFDSQANLTSSFEYQPKTDLRTVLETQIPLTQEFFSQTKVKNTYLLPNLKNTSSSLFNAFNDIDRPFLLKNVLKHDLFDWILIDTPPNLDIQTFNGIIASDYILVPVEYDIYSIQGLNELFENVEKIKQRANPNIKILGILITQVDQRSSINVPIQEKLDKDFAKYLLKSTIRTNTQFRIAQAFKSDIFSHGDLKGIEDYNNLTSEIIKLTT